MRSLLVLAFMTLAVAPAAAQVSGRATALSSDSLSINGEAFALFGIDGVELHQFCFVNGRPLACGATATRAFQTLVDPVVVTCTPTGATAGAAAVAVCTSEEGDLADLIVREGWALADREISTDYVAAEDAARAEGVGVWQGTFVEPWTYRSNLDAVARRYVAAAMPGIQADAAAILLAPPDDRRFGVLTGFTIELGPTAATAAPSDFTRGDIDRALIEQPFGATGVFRWEDVATALGAWGDAIVGEIAQDAIDDLWLELRRRPGTDVVLEEEDQGAYYDAVIAAAEPILAAGRQPILIVASRAVPFWIDDWFLGYPPPGAVTEAKEIEDPNYIGTIDGVDVYVGVTPNDISLVFPQDILSALVYADQGGGAVVAAAGTPPEDPTDWVLHYVREVRWRDDPVVRITYPFDPNPYNLGS
ncbi:MAG: thermonuclease family protein [Bauldia sp.]